MNDVPVQLIVAAFKDEEAAEGVLQELKAAKREGLVGIQNAAVIRRDAGGKVHIKDVRDVGGGKGAAFGALVGVGIGLLTGGVGLVLGGAVGALVGGLTAKTVDMGLPNERLKEIADALQPGNSAIIAIVEHTWVADLEQAFADAQAQVFREALKADIAAQLEAGKDVAYSALASEEGLDLERMAASEEEMELSGLQVTDEGVAAQATLMTKDGAISRAVTLTAEGLSASEVGVTPAGVIGEGVVVTQEGTTHAEFVAPAAELPEETPEEPPAEEGK